MEPMGTLHPEISTLTPAPDKLKEGAQSSPYKRILYCFLG